MRVVVTGITGLIGRALTPLLRQDGYEVIGLTRGPSRAANETDLGVPLAHWDGRSNEGWGALADGALAIINLAGENIGAKRWSAAQKSAILDSRRDAARAVMQAVALARTPPRVLIQASGVGYYGRSGEAVVDESAAAGGGFLAGVAALGEAEVADAAKYGVRVVCLRTSVVLAQHGGALAKMLPLFRFWLGGPLGNGQAWFPWIHLTDELGAIRHLLKHDDLRGPFNLVAPGIVRQRDFARALGRALHRPAVMPAPAFALKVMLGEMAEEVLLTGQHAVPRKLLDSGFHFTYPDLDQALQALFR